MRPRAAATLAARLGGGLVLVSPPAVADLRDGVMRRTGAVRPGGPTRPFVGRVVEGVTFVGSEAALVAAPVAALVSAGVGRRFVPVGIAETAATRALVWVASAAWLATSFPR